MDLDAQLQPNGFDLTLSTIAKFESAGTIGVSNADRSLPETHELKFDLSGSVRLAPGPYLFTLNEEVWLPPDVMALGKPRSSLLRSGVAIHNAVWDAGYRGRSQALMVVYNPKGFTLSRNARILQLVFLALESPTATLYAGQYQSENITR